jgi:Peptidase S46
MQISTLSFSKFASCKCKAHSFKNSIIIFTMKKIILILAISIFSKVTIAKEGMWLPFLLEQLNQKEMRAMGLKITAKDIYNESKSSLKDAVVIFGGGCTGEVISKEGLVLTNHHCGYGTVAALANLQNDYLKNGFWAMNNQQELPCPGLSVTFINKIIDVTTTVTTGVSDNLRDTTRQKEVAKRIEKLIKENSINGYTAIVKSFFADNKYYMFITEKFTDIRLVGFPPNGIGKFGGDTDNWAWPRHTGDFSVFRIYTNKDNKAAAYNKENIPFKPKKFLTINAAGIKEGDFSMVYGFPGRTQENLTGAGVNELMNVLDPARIKIREERLKIMDEDMRSDRKIFLQYAGKQAGIANYYKKWKGELEGLRINDAVNKKYDAEIGFNNWCNSNPIYKTNYGNIISDIKTKYDAQKEMALLNEYFNEAWGACEALTQCGTFEKIIGTLERTKNTDSIQNFKAQWEGFYKSYNTATDKKITVKLMQLFADKFPNLKLDAFEKTEKLFEKTIATDAEKMMALLNQKDYKDIINVLKNDVGYKCYQEMTNTQTENFNVFRKNQTELIALYHTFVQGKFVRANGSPIYPDANSTLRVSYGKIEGITPKDGMYYNYYTTLDGAMAKEDSTIEEFEVPAKLKQLWQAKDYGRYAMPNGKMPLAFLASNHTTGGNSGSPVLNAYGQLIGTNFDRIYEGTMSDVMYDINLCRNITVDARYTLFIIDKFGGAGWLLNEMNIIWPTVKTKKLASK